MGKRREKNKEEGEERRELYLEEKPCALYGTKWQSCIQLETAD